LDSDATILQSEKSFAMFIESKGIAKAQEIKVVLVTSPSRNATKFCCVCMTTEEKPAI